MLGIFWCLDLLVGLPPRAPAHPAGTGKGLADRAAREELPVPIGLATTRSRRKAAERAASRAVLRQLVRHRSPTYRPEPGRILMITSTYNRGGVERQMIATASGLIQRGYDVRIMALGLLEPGTPSVEAEI